MTDNSKKLENFADELAEEERLHDEAYGAAYDAWFDDNVLEKYKRAQNARLVNAFASRVLKSYVPGQHNEHQETGSATDVPSGGNKK